MLFKHKKKQEEEQEAESLMKYLQFRFNHNQNWLCAITGSTGSGKSYSSIRICELWYKYYFDKPFPIQNVCFSISKLVRRIKSGELEKGELLILEESGVQVGSKDFMTKLSKAFGFFMQSFRSKNIGLIFNLPLLKMMNKDVRVLVHSHFITHKIKHTEKICQLKPYYIQLNQRSGKEYPKYLRKWEKRGDYNFRKPVKMLYLNLPAVELTSVYETNKNAFVDEVGDRLLTTAEESEGIAKKQLTPFQQRVVEDVEKYPISNYTDRAKRLGKRPWSVSSSLVFIQKKGYNMQNALENRGLPTKQVESPPI